MKKCVPVVLRSAAAGLCALLLIINGLQTREIRDLRGQMDHLQNRAMETMENVSALRGELHSFASSVQAGESMVSSHSIRLVGVVPDSQSFKAEVSLRLKEWREDTRVWLILDGPGVPRQKIPVNGGNGDYSVLADLPSDLEGLTLQAESETDGLHREELLETLGSLNSLLPVQSGGGGWAVSYSSAGASLTVSDCSIFLHNPSGGEAEISAPVFCVSVNEKAVLTEAARQNGGEWLGPLPTEPWDIPCQEGDRVTLSFSCQDQFGLTYTFFVDGKQIQERLSESISGDPAPRIAWPVLPPESVS